MIHLASLPIPKADIARAITGANKLAVRRDLHVDTVPGVIVPAEALLAVLPELVGGAVHDDLVIA